MATRLSSVSGTIDRMVPSDRTATMRPRCASRLVRRRHSSPIESTKCQAFVNSRTDHRTTPSSRIVTVLFSLALQAAVIYVPFLQNAFSTVALGARDWLVCAAVASSVLWVRELTKLARRSWTFAGWSKRTRNS